MLFLYSPVSEPHPVEGDGFGMLKALSQNFPE